MTRLQKALTTYFTPGDIIGDTYSKDRVISFDWNNGNWHVKVQAIKNDGTNDERWPLQRIHSTEPRQFAKILR